MKKLILFCLLFLTSCTQQNVGREIEKTSTQEHNTPDQYSYFGVAQPIANGLYTLRIPESFKKLEDVNNEYDAFYVNDDVQIGFFSLHFQKTEVENISLDALLDTVMENFDIQSSNTIGNMIQNIYGYSVVDKKYIGKNQDKDSIFYVRGYEFENVYIIYTVFTHPDRFENNIGTMFQLIESLKKS